MKGYLVKIGIDLDNTINENATTVAFFAFITNAFRGNSEIYIITNRDEDDYDATVDELDELGIHYDYLVITADKERVILDNDISIYFDDTDEYFINLPETVTVFKIREGGNFDFLKHKWIYGSKTGFDINGK